jgi:hypothetical protein
MSGEGEPSKSSDHIFLPGLVMAALAMIGYLTAQPSLRSARPTRVAPNVFPTPASPKGIESFYSRLWEDPLQLCYLHEEERTAPKKLLWQWEKLFDSGGHVDSAPYKKSFADILDNTHSKLICMPVLVPGARYEDDQELRRRTCYAIYSALAVSHYNSVFPTRMAYVDVPVKVCLPVFTEPRDVPRFRVPVKLFQKAMPNGSNIDDDEFLVVLWINEDLAQNRPLNVIAQILTELFKPAEDNKQVWHKTQERIDVRILGPSSSDGLKTIRAELNRPATDDGADALNVMPSDFGSSIIYSPRATLPEIFFAAGKPTEASVSLEPRRTQIVRTIGDDNVLADALVNELALRCNFDKNSTLILLTERDTLYGQSFPAVFRASLKKVMSDITVFECPFLRGIDGEIPENSPVAKSYGPSASNSAAEADDRREATNDIRPNGNSQLDYLARLEVKLAALNREHYLTYGNGIAAIGIVGTDVFDKLLILRALRTRLPEVIFFTTDLDAEFDDDAERKTTRNLIVASHFGLELAEPLQQHVPPFRDSYQTGTYFGAMAALKSEGVSRALGKLALDPWGYQQNDPPCHRLRPLLFELGLQGPYQLTMTQQPRECATAMVHPRSPREVMTASQTIRLAGCIFGGAFALGFCLFVYVSPLRRAILGSGKVQGKDALKVAAAHVCLLILLFVVPFFWILWDHHRANGQPFAIADGISLWPATFVRYLAVWIAMLLIVVSLRDLTRSTSGFDRRQGAVDPQPLRFGWSQLREFWGRLGFKAALSAGLKNICLFNWPEVRPESNRERAGSVKATALYNDYAQRGAWQFRLLRVAPLAVAYWIFSVCLMMAFGSPSRPYRGSVSDQTSIVVLVISVILMILLVFLVIDATQLCRRFVGALKYADLDWSFSELNPMRVARGDDSYATRALYTIRLISDSSHVVGKLIIYPFIVVFLMVVARIPAFEYPDISWILVLLWTLIAGAAVVASLYVRRSASDTREELLRRLDDKMALAIGDPKQKELLQQTISAIRNETGGAFGPLIGDPLLTALAIPFGGATGVLLIQQLLPALFI